MRSSFDQTFNINTISIHTVEGASCVNIGYNFPTGFESFKKHTQGFGTISGDNNQIDGLKTLLSDQSIADTFNGSDQSDSDNQWIRELMESKMLEILEAEEIEDPFEDEDEEEEEEETISTEPVQSEQTAFLNRLKEAYNDLDDVDDAYELLEDLYEDED